jgi:aspartyl-tRNA(Asn)/glutamyl-tRNA(Gln) amidotransferase subunit A
MLHDLVQDLARNTTRSIDLLEAGYRKADEPAAAAVFTLRLDADARRRAAAADALRAAGGGTLYLGIPITIKDNFDLAGHPTTAGSVFLRDAPVADQDAEAVRRLRDAGFIVMGRTNMTEFAFSGLGLNPHYGTPRNPAFPGEDRIPGGSSSGAAVSVALDMAPFAVGTDTGGSVRIPAALCGLVGFKPSASAISQRGVLPLSTSLDSVGVIAKSVACCASAFSIMAGTEDHPSRASLRGVQLAVIDNYVFGGIEDPVVRAFERAVARLEAAGATVSRLKIPELDGIPALHAKGTFAGAEAYAWHREYLAANGPAYDQRVLTRISAAGAMSAADYILLRQRRADFIAAVSARTQDFDALLAPTVPVIAPRIADLAEDEQFHAVNGLILRNPTVVNLLDGCAISLPCQAPGEPPVGLSLIGLNGSDQVILRLARAAEAAITGA